MGAGLNNAEVAEIYRDYGHLLLRRCRFLLHDQALADDALQDVFVKIINHGHALRAADSKLAWLYRVADHCCFDLLGRRRAQRTVQQAATAAEPASEARAHEARNFVAKLLPRLGRKELRVAVLAFVDGLTQERISVEVGWSRQTVNKKLRAIRARAQRMGLHVDAG